MTQTVLCAAEIAHPEIIPRINELKDVVLLAWEVKVQDLERRGRVITVPMEVDDGFIVVVIIISLKDLE